MQASRVGRGRSPLSIRPQAVLAALAACAFVVLLIVGSGPPERPKPSSSGSNSVSHAPKATSADQLRRLSTTTSQPVYWLGEQSRSKLELTRTATGRIFVRYLPASAQIGDPSLAYPFVATYKYPRAFDAVKKAAGTEGSVARGLPAGGLAVQSRRGPELVRATPQPLPAPPVFLAYPGSDFLVEVYDRSTDRALGLVTSGRVRPVR